MEKPTYFVLSLTFDCTRRYAAMAALSYSQLAKMKYNPRSQASSPKNSQPPPWPTQIKSI
ncbi:hypothetical protein L484_019742 [Morus notabilis]|uniref:Uncharacterized protein n=1 Tax=Morus notabilis TaxID=981085 RepID=W9R1W2_9ROSA|nr:hypothetical protein L484_019742 [Morus notabilis]